MDKPHIFTEGSYTVADLERLSREKPVWKTFDIFQLQLEELFEIEHPDQTGGNNYQRQLDAHNKQKVSGNPSVMGDWAYFPWNGNLIHTLSENDVFRLRTNRNQLLITRQEQEKLLNQQVGLIGLSIGASYATSMAYSGIAKTMKLADMDILSTSNLNRVKACMADVGKAKVEIVAQQIYEINPYQQLEIYADGLNYDTIDKFIGVESPSKLGLVFEAVDDFSLKVLTRVKAQIHQIPVIMLTNLGDSILIDVERYDIEPNVLPFNGRLSQEILDEILAKRVARENIIGYITDLLGLENLSTAIHNSLDQMGKSLVGRPQLFSSVTIGGGLAAYLAKQVFLNRPLRSGRYKLSLDALFKIENSDNLLEREGAINQLFERNHQ